MKRTLTLFFGMVIASLQFVLAQGTLSKEERKAAIDQLKASQEATIKAVQSLNDTQLNYKPADSVWSVAECLEHIVISEKNLFQMVQGTLAEENDLASTVPDDQVTAIITSRAQKVTTRDNLVPTKQFGSFNGTLKAYQQARSQTIDFVKSTDQDLRGDAVTFPFGNIDMYQVILFMAGHNERHYQQMKEVMGSKGFPKS